MSHLPSPNLPVLMHQHFFSGVVRQWHRLPREVMQTRSLEVFRKDRDLALKNVVSGHSEDGKTVGQDNLRGQP